MIPQNKNGDFKMTTNKPFTLADTDATQNYAGQKMEAGNSIRGRGDDQSRNTEHWRTKSTGYMIFMTMMLDCCSWKE